jgi:NCAIR mutase (PurE)-related protein
MNPQQMLELLEKVRQGALSPEEGLDRLKHMPFEDLGFARVDHHRTIRQGFPEVIFGPGKKPEQVVAIAKSLLKQKSNILVTRTNAETYKKVRKLTSKAQFHESARAITIVNDAKTYGDGTIYVVCAGTSDIPVADEAALTTWALPEFTVC